MKGITLDSRVALKANTKLTFRNGEDQLPPFIISKEIGRGASCIVYEAYTLSNTGDKKFYRVKECYPYNLHIERGEAEHLDVSGDDAHDFNEEKSRFVNDFTISNSVFYQNQLYCYMPDQLDIYDCNNTKYIVSTYSSDTTLATYKPKNVKECITLVKKVAYVVKKIHDQGYLFLDIKPGNVLVIDDFERYIKLLDFDSLVAISDIENSQTKDSAEIRLSFSKGFAPLELETGKLQKLGPHTDVYGIGTLLFWMLFSDTPSAKDIESDAKFDFAKIAYDLDCCDVKLLNRLSDFFHSALASFYLDRYQNMEDVLSALEELEHLADPMVPRIVSTVINAPKNLIGRTAELQNVDEFVQRSNQNCMFITGMGGIGKSSIIRHYLVAHRGDFDTILYMNFDGDIRRTISDDNNVRITTLNLFEFDKHAGSGETSYFDKKIQEIKKLTEETKAIIVVDNFSGEIDEPVRAVLQIGCKVVLVSRQNFTYPDAEVLKINAIENPSDLCATFETNLGRNVDDTEKPDLDRIIEIVAGHTLILELIAKQVASSYLSVSDALELIENKGFAHIAGEKIQYAQDGLTHTEALIDIIEMLFQAGDLSVDKKCLLRVTSLLTADGINIHLLKECLQLDSFDVINGLVRDGWLIVDEDDVSMHPVIQEAVRQWCWNDELTDAADIFIQNIDELIRQEATVNNVPKKIYWTTHDMDDEEDIRPVDMVMLLYYLLIAEQVISMSKFDVDLRQFQSFKELYITSILYLTRNDEELILQKAHTVLTAEQARIKQIELGEFSPSDLKFVISILRIYQVLVDIYVDKCDVGAIEDILDSAKKLTEVSGVDKALSLYYDMKSEYYDLCLNGAYDAETAEEEELLDKFLASIEKTLKYSKDFAAEDKQFLYINGLLSKAMVLMRSCRGKAEEIKNLLEQAADCVLDYSLPFADVRLSYYMVCAWFYALVMEDEKLTDEHVMQAFKLAKMISATDLDIIDNNLIPCANIYYELANPEKALSMLEAGINICAEHANTEVYDRKKRELNGYYEEVCKAFGIDNLCIMSDLRNNHS